MSVQTIPETTSPTDDGGRPITRRARHQRPALLTLPVEGDGLVREGQACAALQIGRSTLWRWAVAGRLRPVRLGGMTRWRISDLRALVNTDSVL